MTAVSFSGGVRIHVSGARGPRGLPSGPLGDGSVDADTITNDLGEQSAILVKLGITEALEAKVDADLSNADFTYPNVTAAQGFPYYNFRTQKRNLADFIDKAQWANCRAGTPAVAATNGLGQDSFAAAVADMEGAVGGEIQVPDGYFRLPQMLVQQSNLTIRGNGRSSVIQSTSATAHQIDVDAVSATIADLDFATTVTRTLGAFVRVRPTGSRFHAEALVSRNAYTLLHIGDIASSDEGGIFTARNLRAEDTVTGGYAYVVEGGYLVNFDNIIQSGSPLISALTGPAAGLRVLRCADLRVGGNSQIINCQRGLDVIPPAGKTVASLRFEGGFFGTSYYGSRISGVDGGTIVSMQARGVWFGENLSAGGGATGVGAGLTIAGTAADRIKQIVLTDCEFPLCQGDGLNVDQYVRGLQVMGGWADGNGGSGYAFNGTQGFSLIGTRSGGERFGGNALPYFIGALSDYFRIIGNDFTGNTGSGTAPTPSASKIFANNIS